CKLKSTPRTPSSRSYGPIASGSANRSSTVKGVLGDINIQGHVEVLRHVWESAAWREIWNSLGLSIYTFAELGLSVDASDVVIRHLCQQQQLVLLTANRNEEGPDSLESTIRNRNTQGSLETKPWRKGHEPADLDASRDFVVGRRLSRDRRTLAYESERRNSWHRRRDVESYRYR